MGQASDRHDAELRDPTVSRADGPSAGEVDGVPPELPVAFSVREQMVATLVAGDHSVKDVSLSLGLSSETVLSYLAQTRKKYSAAGRQADTLSQLRERLIEDGLLRDETNNVAEPSPPSPPSTPDTPRAIESGKVISYRVIFEDPSEDRHVGATALVAIRPEGHDFPQVLVDPVDYADRPIGGTWRFNGVMEAHGVVFYKRVL